MKAIGARQSLPVSDPGCLIEFVTPTPEPGPLDVLIRTHAIAINPVDTKIRTNLGSDSLDPPRILGWDCSGTIEAIGSDVTGFSPGDEGFCAGDLTRPGCNAEFLAVDSRLIATKPKSWSHEQAAAIPLVGITAWELLFERMGASPDGRDQGKALLIINGAGGVGSALIPLARAAGLTVVATASRPETKDWCTSLGAHHVINHREPLRPQTQALGIDTFPYIANLYNTESYWETTADLIAPLGALGLIVEPNEKLHFGDPLKAKCIRIAWEFMAARAMFKLPDIQRQGEILAEISRRCDAGTFPHIHTRTFDSLTPENLRQAHAAMENSSAHGKWVITAKF